MRQAYDYWQDQPDNYLPATPLALKPEGPKSKGSCNRQNHKGRQNAFYEKTTLIAMLSFDRLYPCRTVVIKFRIRPLPTRSPPKGTDAGKQKAPVCHVLVGFSLKRVPSEEHVELRWYSHPPKSLRIVSKFRSRRPFDRVGFNREATMRNGLRSPSSPHKVGFNAIVTHREQMQIFPSHLNAS